MALSEEQAAKIKDHLLKQLDNFPKEKKEQIEKQVKEMDTGQVEEFINENQLTHLGNQCVFCSIIANKIPSVKIAENSDNIAILEINPLSKGHTLVLPKDHQENILDSTKELAKQISEKILKKFSPKEIKINETKIMDHPVLEIIPIYGGEKERSQKTLEQLEKLKFELEKVDKEIKIEPKKEESEISLPRLKVRIP